MVWTCTQLACVYCLQHNIGAVEQIFLGHRPLLNITISWYSSFLSFFYFVVRILIFSVCCAIVCIFHAVKNCDSIVDVITDYFYADASRERLYYLFIVFDQWKQNKTLFWFCFVELYLNSFQCIGMVFMHIREYKVSIVESKCEFNDLKKKTNVNNIYCTCDFCHHSMTPIRFYWSNHHLWNRRGLQFFVPFFDNLII